MLGGRRTLAFEKRRKKKEKERIPASAEQTIYSQMVPHLVRDWDVSSAWFQGPEYNALISPSNMYQHSESR